VNRTAIFRFVPLVSLALLACGSDQVTVQVIVPDDAGVEAPVPGVRLLVVPYNRDSILQALENRAPSPRPSTSELDSLFQAFRGPFNAYLTASRRLREDSTPAAAAAAEEARQALARVRKQVTPRADSIRARIAAWEDTAFASFDSITGALIYRGKPAVVDSTRSDGWATVPVPGKRWWLTARAINLQDPNTEWYWNVPVTGDTIRLTPQNGRTRPRFR
jgi:hypothetical protein